MLRHASAAVVFAALAVVWTFPLVTDLSGQLPGAGPGDNLSFLWNFWWMRTALAQGLDFFHTPFLFAPVGADLTLHTHTALPAFVGATAAASLSTVTALNVTILASLALNGFCAYLLAWRTVRDWGPAILAGLVFACSSYLAGRLNGHFNLTAAWTIPLFAIGILDAVQRRRLHSAALSGVILAATVYIDYYYVVYQLVLGGLIVVLAARQWTATLRGPGVSTALRWMSRATVVLTAAVGALIVAIAATGGFTLAIGGRTISMHGLFNPLQAFWLLVMLWLWLRFRPRITARPHVSPPRLLAPVLVMTAVFAVGASPVILNAADLVLRGDYVTQTYFWRSAPRGIDLATLMLGPPFHGLFGGSILSGYHTLRIDAIEASGWLGIVPVVLAIGALRQHGARTEVDRWGVIGLVFLVWSCGPHLMAFGRGTGMILPGAFLRYLPIVNNARMPGRALVVVLLALALLASIGASQWRPALRRRSLLVGGLAALIIAESIPAPFPVVRLESPRLYEVLRDRPETGAVCELPLGVHDGLGGRGLIEDLVLYYQTIHERPLVGGYLSRIAPSLAAYYGRDPLLDGLLRLSESDQSLVPLLLPTAEVAADGMRTNGIRFVVLNHRLASVRLAEYVKNVLPLQLILREGDRSLYVVSGR